MRSREEGVVGINLVLVVTFALYAVIMLSWTTLSADQIDDRVEVITAVVGPGSNVSRLDEVAKLNEIGRTAEEIAAVARPLSGQLQTVLGAAQSIDETVSGINANAAEINTTAKSINGKTAELVPVVRQINGEGGLEGGGVEAINLRVAAAGNAVGGIGNDLGAVSERVGAAGVEAHGGDNIHGHVNSINCSLPIFLAGLNPLLSQPPNGCNAF